MHQKRGVCVEKQRVRAVSIDRKCIWNTHAAAPGEKFTHAFDKWLKRRICSLPLSVNDTNKPTRALECKSHLVGMHFRTDVLLQQVQVIFYLFLLSWQEEIIWAESRAPGHAWPPLRMCVNKQKTRRKREIKSERETLLRPMPAKGQTNSTKNDKQSGTISMQQNKSRYPNLRSYKTRKSFCEYVCADKIVSQQHQNN